MVMNSIGVRCLVFVTQPAPDRVQRRERISPARQRRAVESGAYQWPAQIESKPSTFFYGGSMTVVIIPSASRLRHRDNRKGATRWTKHECHRSTTQSCGAARGNSCCSAYLRDAPGAVSGRAVWIDLRAVAADYRRCAGYAFSVFTTRTSVARKREGSRGSGSAL